MLSTANFTASTLDVYSVEFFPLSTSSVKDGLEIVTSNGPTTASASSVVSDTVPASNLSIAFCMSVVTFSGSIVVSTATSEFSPFLLL